MVNPRAATSDRTARRRAVSVDAIPAKGMRPPSVILRARPYGKVCDLTVTLTVADLYFEHPHA
jgi:hypothetical protein